MVTEETRKKMSESHKGKKRSLEIRRKISESCKGKKRSLETRKRMSQAQTGKKLPLKTIIKLRKANGGKNNGFYRKKHKPESIRKMSEYHKGKKLSEKHKRKISESQKGKKVSFKTRKKMSQSGKGRIFSLEHKRNLSEGRIGEKNSQWLGGKSFELYGIEFNKDLKELIRARDNYCCQECNKYESELFTKKGKTKKLACHHINYLKTDNRPCNLISLCPKCHAKTGFKRKDWTKYFQKKNIAYAKGVV